MATISVTLEGAILQEVPLNKAKITIGRRPTNDVVLNHLAISGEHAVITAHRDGAKVEFTIEDCRSTNGMHFGGKKVPKHVFKNGDMVVLARYQLKFKDDNNAQQDQLTTIPKPAAPLGKPSVLEVLNGANAGKQLVLTKELTTLGTPGVQVATITRVGSAYQLRHTQGDQAILITGQAVGSRAMELKAGAVIDLSGPQLQFVAD